jgi:hypothetical protein
VGPFQSSKTKAAKAAFFLGAHERQISFSRRWEAARGHGRWRPFTSHLERLEDAADLIEFLRRNSAATPNEH